jgi:hypothetical protein
MSTLTIAGLLLIVVPLAFNAAFALLAARFGYPDILRQPTADVLATAPVVRRRRRVQQRPARPRG